MTKLADAKNFVFSTASGGISVYPTLALAPEQHSTEQTEACTARATIRTYNTIQRRRTCVEQFIPSSMVPSLSRVLFAAKCPSSPNPNGGPALRRGQQGSLMQGEPKTLGLINNHPSIEFGDARKYLVRTEKRNMVLYQKMREQEQEQECC